MVLMVLKQFVGQNRFEGCYVDDSRLVLVNVNDVEWTNGFMLASNAEFQGWP